MSCSLATGASVLGDLISRDYGHTFSKLAQERKRTVAAHGIWELCLDASGCIASDTDKTFSGFMGAVKINCTARKLEPRVFPHLVLVLMEKALGT